MTNPFAKIPRNMGHLNGAVCAQRRPAATLGTLQQEMLGYQHALAQTGIRGTVVSRWGELLAGLPRERLTPLNLSGAIRTTLQSVTLLPEMSDTAQSFSDRYVRTYLNRGAIVLHWPGTTYASSQVPGHELIEQIGFGTAGEVYAGLEWATGSPVAIKIMRTRSHDGPCPLSGASAEIRTQYLTKRPRSVPIFEFGRTRKQYPYITMELLAGGSVHDWLNAPGADWSLERAMAIGAEMIRAVAEVHHEGIIHRDLKPSSFLFDATRRHVKLSDFGLAVMADEARPNSMRVGTMSFLPYEAWRSDYVDTMTRDVFSLGITLYRLMTKALPGDPFNRPTPPSRQRTAYGLPAYWDDLILKAMARDPADRFQTGGEMLHALTSTRN